LAPERAKFFVAPLRRTFSQCVCRERANGANIVDFHSRNSPIRAICVEYFACMFRMMSTNAAQDVILRHGFASQDKSCPAKKFQGRSGLGGGAGFG
jgi:hypothetical protein